jgi:hypothetical protein
MSAPSVKRRLPAFIAVLLTMATLATGYLATRADATHQPADKVAATGSTIEILKNDGIAANELPPNTVAPDDTKAVLEATLKTSDPSDLLINVAAECALWTLTKSIDDPEDLPSTSRAEANVTMWLTVDSNNPNVGRVPVSGTQDGGDVVFCDRAQQLRTQDLEDDDPECSDDPEDPDACTYVELFQRTRNANGFNWVAFNLGRGPHTVRLWAHLETNNTTDGPADLAESNAAASAAGIGKRTMLIQPVKFPHHVGSA